LPDRRRGAKVSALSNNTPRHVVKYSKFTTFNRNCRRINKKALPPIANKTGTNEYGGKALLLQHRQQGVMGFVLADSPPIAGD